MLGLAIMIIFCVALFIIGFGNGYKRKWIVGFGYVVAFINFVGCFIIAWVVKMGIYTEINILSLIGLVIAFIVAEPLGEYVGRWHKRKCEKSVEVI